MGQTHEDSDFPENELIQQLFRESKEEANLIKRAQEMQDHAEITAGKPGELKIEVGEYYGVYIIRRPEDPDCLRVSIGEVRDNKHSRYLVFRGPIKEIADLIQRAGRALERVIKK